MIRNFFTMLLMTFLSAFVFTACNDGSTESEREINLIQDSTAFDNNASSDTAITQHQSDEILPETVPAAPAMHPASKAKKPAQKSDKVKTSESVAPAPEPAPAETVIAEPAPAPKEEPVVTEKKGMSKTAQGAIIGGAAGAVGGAIISNKKGVGAAVGAVVGAGAGAIIGKQKDKKDQQKKEEAQKAESANN